MRYIHSIHPAYTTSLYTFPTAPPWVHRAAARCTCCRRSTRIRGPMVRGSHLGSRSQKSLGGRPEAGHYAQSCLFCSVRARPRARGRASSSDERLDSTRATSGPGSSRELPGAEQLVCSARRVVPVASRPEPCLPFVGTLSAKPGPLRPWRPERVARVCLTGGTTHIGREASRGRSAPLRCSIILRDQVLGALRE